MRTDSAVDVKQWIDGRPLVGRQWLVLILCFFIILFDGMDVAVMGFVGPSLMQEWNLSKTDFSLVISAAIIGLAVGAVVAGPYADRIGRRKVLLAAVTVFGIFSLSTAFAPGPVELAVLRFLTGLGLGAAMPNTSTLVAEYLPERLRSLLITVLYTGFTLGSACAGFIAAWLIPHYGWQSVLLVVGILPLVLFPFLWLFLPESVHFLVVSGVPATRIAKLLNKLGGQFTADTRFIGVERSSPNKAPVGKLFSEQYRLGTFTLWIAYFHGLLVVYLMTGWLPTLIREAGISVERAAIITGLFQIGGTVGSVAVGWFMDRYHPNRVIAWTYMLGSGFVLALGILGMHSSFLTIGIILAGFCVSGAQTGLNAFAPGYYPTEARATGVSWMQGVGRFGAVFGSMIGGTILSLGLSFNLVFCILAVPSFIAALAILINGCTVRRVSNNKPTVVT